MPGTFFGIEIARRALQTNKQAMDVTGNNLANANTTGYTRQEAVFSTTPALPVYTTKYRDGPGQLGTGVEISEVRRVRDDYLDIQARDNMAEIGYWQAQQDALGRVEAVFPEQSDNGLQKLMQGFFAAWHDLSQTPDSQASRANVRESADALASGIRSAYAQLTGIDQDLEKTLSDAGIGQIRKFNDFAAQVKNLNNDIVKARKMGVTPADLLDKRDLLLENMSSLLNISVIHESDGSVSVASGEITLVDGPGATVNNLTSGDFANPRGAIGGLIDVREKIKVYLADLNEMAGAMLEEVNTLNRANGDIDFFKAGANPAADIDISDEVHADLNNINGQNSLSIAKLREELTMTGGTETFEGFYQMKLIGGIASAGNGAEVNLAGRQAVQQQLESMRQSLSGVSIDEELTKMVQYQYAYQASAKMITTLDEMLATLIDMVR